MTAKLSVNAVAVLVSAFSVLASNAQAPSNSKGTMLDNTLIVYTSDSGEVQHSHGNHGPFLLIGDPVAVR